MASSCQKRKTRSSGIPTGLEQMVNNEIWRVLTATEAARLWELSDSTIRRACLEGRLNCRKSGATWLVDKDEMYRVYGDPPLESEAELEQRHPARPASGQQETGNGDE